VLPDGWRRQPRLQQRLKAADVADAAPDDTPPYQDGENVDGFDYSLVPQDGESFGPYAGPGTMHVFDVHVLHWPMTMAWKAVRRKHRPGTPPDIDNLGHVRPPSQKMDMGKRHRLTIPAGSPASWPMTERRNVECRVAQLRMMMALDGITSWERVTSRVSCRPLDPSRRRRPA